MKITTCNDVSHVNFCQTLRASKEPASLAGGRDQAARHTHTYINIYEYIYVCVSVCVHTLPVQGLDTTPKATSSIFFLSLWFFLRSRPIRNCITYGTL